MLNEAMPTPALVMLVSNTMKKLPLDEWQVVVGHSLANEAFVKDLIAKDPELAKHHSDGVLSTRVVSVQDPAAVHKHLSGFWYQEMLLSPVFWANVPYEWVMILETDSYLCEMVPRGITANARPFLGGLTGFVAFPTRDPDYDPGETYENVVRRSPAKVWIMNGGFSLRNVKWAQWCVDIVKKGAFPEIRGWTDDSKFSYCAKKDWAKYRDMKASEAWAFSSNVMHTVRRRRCKLNTSG